MQAPSGMPHAGVYRRSTVAPREMQASADSAREGRADGVEKHETQSDGTPGGGEEPQ